MQRVRLSSVFFCVLAALLVLSLTLVGCSSTPSTVVTTATTTAITTATSISTTTATTTTTNTIKATKLTFSNWYPPPNAATIAMQKWATDFEKVTNGRYDIEIISGGAIANGGKGWDAVVNGICDIASYVPKETDKPFPLFTMPTLPTGDSDQALATKVWFSMTQKNYFDKELANVKPVFSWLGFNEDVTTKNPVNGVDEFKGMKLVVPGGASVDIAQAVGAVPVAGGPPDAYELVSKGVADGIYIGGLGYKEFQWASVVHYRILPMMFSKNVNAVAMNQNVYNNFPADVKAIFDKMAADPQYAVMAASGQYAQLQEAYNYFHEVGGKDIDWSPAEKAKLAALIKPMWDKWLKANETQGATQVINDYYNGMKAAGINDPTPGYTP